MKTNKLMVKVMTGLIVAGVTLSTGVTAFAATKDVKTNKIQTVQRGNREGAKIKAALPQGKGHKGGMREKIDFSTAFDSLVTAGTITQGQEDKIVEFMNKKAEARKTEMEKIKAMTEEERKAYFEANKGKERTDIFKELVDAGILNQSQADAAKKVLPQHKGIKGNKNKTTSTTPTVTQQ